MSIESSCQSFRNPAAQLSRHSKSLRLAALRNNTSKLIRSAEKTDPGDARRASFQATCAGLARDAAQRQHGKPSQFTSDLSKSLDANRRAVVWLRYSFEDWSEHDKVGATISRYSRFRKRMR